MGIIYYNADRVRRIYPDIPHEYIDPEHRELYAGYNSLCRFFEPICLIDRSGQHRHFLNVENVCPMPPFTGSTDSFENLCLHRARDLGKTDKPLILFWSGGIDSTAALLALIETGYANHVKVIMTHLSIIENHNFYKQFIENRVEHDILNSEDVRKSVKINPDHILVTGELGDQLFGSMTLFRYTINELNESYRMHVPADACAFMEPVLANAPTEIKTLLQFLWWTNFNMKWHNVKYRFLVHSDALCRIDQIEHFFDADYFQKWAVMTDEPKIFRHHRTYKWAAKKFIHNYTHDDDFLQYKLKVPSLRSNRVDKEKIPTFLYSTGELVTV